MKSRRGKLWFLAALLALLAPAFFVACGPRPARSLIVLALDGCDPVLVQRYMQEGKLPNFRRLANLGGFRALKTVLPPQSPVAWSTFITGQDASGHGIFDFIHRDPDTMKVFPSQTRLVNGQLRRNRQGPTFWQPLLDQGIDCTFLKLPADFPPTEDRARKLSGMGTPDLLGSYGTFTEYRDFAGLKKLQTVAGGQIVPIQVEKSQAKGALIGPADSRLDFVLKLDSANRSALVQMVGMQEVLLAEGQWSDWISVRFATSQGEMLGMIRCNLLSLQPLRLYVSPINLDPSRPQQAISTPASYANHLCRCCGPYHTQGMAEDTKALGCGTLDDQQYLAQSSLVAQESYSLLQQGLQEFEGGLFFAYLSSIDLQSHVYWAAQDPQHPLYQQDWAKSHRDVVEKAYLEADRWIERALEYRQSHPQKNCEVLVMSDHGFAPFYRSFDLNAWLVQNGYLTLKAGAELEQADWDKSRAYAVGFNGLYLNRKGRENRGVVAPADCEKLLSEISQALQAVQDQGQPVFSKIYRAQQVYQGARAGEGPDLILGYARGYRAAWETALGQHSGLVIRVNREHWSGDHLVDPDLVPGVLFCSRPLLAEEPQLQEIGPAVRDYLKGVEPKRKVWN